MTATCTHCGQPIRPGARFCGKCGHVQTAASPPQPRAQAQPQAQAQTPPPPVCINCQQPLRGGSRFCARCGADQLAPPVAVQATAVPPTPVTFATPPPATPITSRGSRAYVVRNGLLIAGLALGLLVALFITFQRGEQVAASPVAAAPPPLLTPEVLLPTPTPTADARQAVVTIGHQADGRFGLSTTTGNPGTNSDDNKKLTYSPDGGTSNTRVWIDGQKPLYGSTGTSGSVSLGFLQEPIQEMGGIRSVWKAGDVQVAQRLSYVHGTNTGRVDTLRIEYELTNQGAVDHEVGLRMLIDTLIGGNDGVPFVAPGRAGIIDQAVDMRAGDVPDYLQALEQADLADPGVIVQLTLRGADATPPDRLTISAWCDGNADWDTFQELGGDGHTLRTCGWFIGFPDSAVTLFFDPQPLAPGATRTLVTYYGLGGISSTESGNDRLSLVAPKEVKQGEQFWVVALVLGPQNGQRVHLDLPDGLSLLDATQAEQPVTPGGDFTQVSWQVVADRPGSGDITVTLQPDGVGESQSIRVNAGGITR